MPAETHTQRAPLDRAAISGLVREVVGDLVGRDPDEVGEDERFVEDLGLDSLGAVGLVEALEDELGERSVGLEVDDDDLVELLTVREAVDYVHGRLC